ncbi:hypothetical protein [Nocardia tengchongensis]|uniref:hypothetical protein n=1 Tax=Nocardia tengchongensis TaxID=2055889 RepID=UPI0036ADDA6E
MISLIALAILAALFLGAVFPAVLRVGGAIVSLSALMWLVSHHGIVDTLIGLACLVVGVTCYLLGHLLWARRYGYFQSSLPARVFSLPSLRWMSPVHD